MQVHGLFKRIWPQYEDKQAMAKVKKWIVDTSFGELQRITVAIMFIKKYTNRDGIFSLAKRC